MRSALLVSSLLLISGSLSAATVLDFETYDTVDTINPFTGEPAGCLSGSEPLCIGGDILHKGYAVNWGQASWYQVSDLRLAPCIVYDVCDPLYEGGWNLTQASAQAFNVLSIDVSVNWDDPAYNDSYTGETYPNAFADFLLTFTIDNDDTSVLFQLSRGDMGVSDDFTGIASATLELNWLNVDEFSMYDYSNIDAMAFDNIVVTAVPIPATVWLFGSALAGLGWMRREKA